MAKNKNSKKNNKRNGRNGKLRIFSNITLSEEVKRYILGIVFLSLTIILLLSFLKKTGTEEGMAGVAGSALYSLLFFLFGSSVYLFPVIFAIVGVVFLFTKYDKYFGPLILAFILLVVGLSGLYHTLSWQEGGGRLGELFSAMPVRLFDNLVTVLIFLIFILVSYLIFSKLLRQPQAKKDLKSQEEEQNSLMRKIFAPRFQVKEIEPRVLIPASAPEAKQKGAPKEKKSQLLPSFSGEYEMPPIDLLEQDRGQPLAGDIRQNSVIIKKTLESFEIPVEMSEVNVGPTVTQYTLKPADGIKLAKITGLSNDMALALAAHPIRIEAPIPGKSLVGIEVPNRVRASVHLKGLIEDSKFQSAPNLTICLGRDVAGMPYYADLARMPHLLVAGSTGTGKTIFLNSLVLSLIYRNSPEILRFIMIDPKRVEFPVYNDLPHLLAPVIFDAHKSVNALRWLVGEMERRFGILSEVRARDILGYNEQALKNKTPLLPYIILIVDELADLMAAKGKDMEAGIVRLAQMARAIGIHLVLATQRPSVEVITGLIKANVTSRVAFQVASQVDSRTILDAAGAEKLLGRGDLLFLSAETAKPRRIQGAYVSEKEVRKVIGWLKDNFVHSHLEVERLKVAEEIEGSNMAEDLARSLENPETEFNGYDVGEDPLYEESKRVVIEARKASASLLQRRLRIGYARAARLLDILEEKGIVGPSDGAKPRDVYVPAEPPQEN